MIDGARLRRLRARLDRLPAAWLIVAAGVLLQAGLAVGLLALALSGGDRTELLVAAVLLGVAVVASLAAAPAAVLLYLGRAPRFAVALSVVVGVGTLAGNGFHPTVWPLALALFAAAVRAWAGWIDAATLLDLDPDRFERVEPDGDADGRSGTGDGTGEP